jgi:hypothetical protein
MRSKWKQVAYTCHGRYIFYKLKTLKLIYCAYFHALIKYGVISEGKSSNSVKIFTLQKKILRMTDGAQPRTSRKVLFKQLDFLPVPC